MQAHLLPAAGTIDIEFHLVPRTELRAACVDQAVRSARLAAMWAADDRDRDGHFTLYTVLAHSAGLVWLATPVPGDDPTFTDIADIFLPARRMQRAVRDLVGLSPVAAADAPGEADIRPWLRHSAWREDAYPLRRDFAPETAPVATVESYDFVAVEGDGVHEIPVGPVHAGIIEPGHFRFSVVGEKVLRLEERLGYKHKGIERRFAELDLAGGARLAGRVSGDSTVAYAWAYAMAVEAITATEVPMRALLLRALALERERVANHLGDLGYLGNDGGLAFGLAQFMRLKEEVLRANAIAFGHRYAMDFVLPGGVARDLPREAIDALLRQSETLAAEVRDLWAIYEDHAGLQDRFQTCGIVSGALAQKLGLVGLAARASGQAIDLRVQPGFEPYDRLEVRVVTETAGDVAARAQVRRAEIAESLRLIRAIADRLPAGAARAPLAPAPEHGLAIGCVEGWRGEVLVAIESSGDRIRRAHAHDPSWQNWPALEHAVTGNIVPDFPLINKSFNLSYAGSDG